ncbi:MAG: class I SAM-dependent methyltransferase [bacterium]|nr:class I SAM-dependent methyltransferase [bacterium]
MPGKSSPETACVLCGGSDIVFLFKDKRREYLKCLSCDLVFVPPDQHLTPEEELKRYSLHQNNPEDEGYNKFLKRMFNPLNTLIPSGSYGLDFGSGPNPVLSRMFIERGHKMEIYDPFYAKDRSVFNKKYDFITATEVVEHLFDPQKELDLLWSCLKPGGSLGIMTRLLSNEDVFTNWYYKEDSSHIAFFSKKSFIWLEKRWNSTPNFIGDDIIIFRKH